MYIESKMIIIGHQVFFWERTKTDFLGYHHNLQTQPNVCKTFSRCIYRRVNYYRQAIKKN